MFDMCIFDDQPLKFKVGYRRRRRRRRRRRCLATTTKEAKGRIRISGTPQTTASNSSLGFPVQSFPTSLYETNPASKQPSCFHRAVNNFHNCQVTFNVIHGQCGSPKRSDQH